MTRLILLVLLGIAAAYYFPDSRTMLLDFADPVIQPLVKWSAKDEMKGIGASVVEHEQLTGELPIRNSWRTWLTWRYPADEARTDPWGSMYQIRAWADSVAIISYGPDRERNTDDDFWVVTPRERRR